MVRETVFNREKEDRENQEGRRMRTAWPSNKAQGIAIFHVWRVELTTADFTDNRFTEARSNANYANEGQTRRMLVRAPREIRAESQPSGLTISSNEDPRLIRNPTLFGKYRYGVVSRWNSYGRRRHDKFDFHRLRYKSYDNEKRKDRENP